MCCPPVLFPTELAGLGAKTASLDARLDGPGTFPTREAGAGSAQATKASATCGMDRQGSGWAEDSHPFAHRFAKAWHGGGLG